MPQAAQARANSGFSAWKPYPGCKRVTLGSPRDIHDLIDAQIAFARRRGADRIGFVGQPDVQRGAVGIAIDGDGRDAHLAAGSRDPDGDLAAIGDEDFLEHAAPIDSKRILARCL